VQRSNDGGARWWFGAVYLVLLALVVPWYWPAGDTRHVHGVPIWAIVTLLAVLATSAFTAWIYLSRSEEEPDESPERRDDATRRDDL
jgi:drug/metabolite transporter (DMT)-like permease